MSDKHLYTGWRTDAGCVVLVDGEPLPPRQDLRNHSPTGFEWGYGGSGPAQLALAILAYEIGDGPAQEVYQDFKFAVIGRLDREDWRLDSNDIARALGLQP